LIGDEKINKIIYSPERKSLPKGKINYKYPSNKEIPSNSKGNNSLINVTSQQGSNCITLKTNYVNNSPLKDNSHQEKDIKKPNNPIFGSIKREECKKLLKECESVQNIVRNSVENIQKILDKANKKINIHKHSFTHNSIDNKENICHSNSKQEMKIKINPKCFQRKNVKLNLVGGQLQKQSEEKIETNSSQRQQKYANNNNNNNRLSIPAKDIKNQNKIISAKEEIVAQENNQGSRPRSHTTGIKVELKKYKTIQEKTSKPKNSQRKKNIQPVSSYLREKARLYAKDKIKAFFVGIKTRKIMKSNIIQAIINELRIIASKYREKPSRILEKQALLQKKLFNDTFEKLFFGLSQKEKSSFDDDNGSQTHPTDGSRNSIRNGFLSKSGSDFQGSLSISQRFSKDSLGLGNSCSKKFWLNEIKEEPSETPRMKDRNELCKKTTVQEVSSFFDKLNQYKNCKMIQSKSKDIEFEV